MADLTLLGQGQEALRLLDARQPLQAAAICRRILASFPKHIDTYVILGRILVQTEPARGSARSVPAGPWSGS